MLGHTLVLGKYWQRSLYSLALMAFGGAATQSIACSGPTSDEIMSLRCNLEFVAGKVINKNELEALNSKLRSNGYLPLEGSSKPTYSTSSVTLTPVVNYEPNINGGNPAKNLVVGGLEFVSDPAHFKVAGLTGGLKLQMDGRYANTGGLVVDVKAKSSLQRAIETPNFSILDQTVSLCFRTQISSWNLSRICHEHLYVKKDLSSATFNNTSIGQYVYSTSKNKTFLNSLEFVHESGGYNFDSMNLTHRTIDFNGAGYTANATWKRSRTISGVRERTFGITSSLNFHVFKELGLENTLVTHQPFLGIERKDSSWTITTRLQVSNNVSFRLGYAKLNSTIDYFDDEYPFASLQVSF
jgi:hypothetical protein